MRTITTKKDKEIEDSEPSGIKVRVMITGQEPKEAKDIAKAVNI